MAVRHLCGSCNKVVAGKSKSVMCDGHCGLWYHASCVGISDNNYNTISALGDVVVWLCGKDKAAFNYWRQTPTLLESILEHQPKVNAALEELRAGVAHIWGVVSSIPHQHLLTGQHSIRSSPGPRVSSVPTEEEVVIPSIEAQRANIEVEIVTPIVDVVHHASNEAFVSDPGELESGVSDGQGPWTNCALCQSLPGRCCMLAGYIHLLRATR